MESEATQAIIAAVLTLIFVCVILIVLFIIFQKKKNILLIKQVKVQQQFEKEIVESQVEIREQTLRNISWELHDNIGQLLTLAKIQLQSVPEHPENIADVTDNLTNILSEVRSLSKIINPDFIESISLFDVLKLEIDRFNRLNYIKSSITFCGEAFSIDQKSEIIIFRILQEFFSNTIKHSKATELFVFLSFEDRKLLITAADNGIGFETSVDSKNGIGLNNMKKRGMLINAEVNIESFKNKGTKLTIVYKQI